LKKNVKFLKIELSVYAYTRCAKKCSNVFLSELGIKSSPNLLIFATRMAKMIELCEVHSFFTSPD